jgi:hypothetical protein
MAKVRSEQVDQDLLDSLVRSRAEEASSRSKFIQAHAFKLSTASSDDPPAKVNETLNPPSFYQHDHIHVEGEGDGLDYAAVIRTALIFPFLLPIGWPAVGTGAGAHAQYDFTFTPPVDGQYSFSALLIAYGTYALAADDGWPDSKEAACNVYGQLYAPNDDPATDKGYQVMFDRGDDNILEADNFSVMTEVSRIAHCKGGTALDLHAGIQALVMARGDGSIADMDLSQQTGAFVCLGLTVTQL